MKAAVGQGAREGVQAAGVVLQEVKAKLEKHPIGRLVMLFGRAKYEKRYIDYDELLEAVTGEDTDAGEDAK